MGTASKRHKNPHSRRNERAILSARRLKAIPLLIKDMNRVADWLNGVSVVQMATIEAGNKLVELVNSDNIQALSEFKFKDYVDSAVKAHAESQKAAQANLAPNVPATEPSPFSGIDRTTATPLTDSMYDSSGASIADAVEQLSQEIAASKESTNGDPAPAQTD